MTISNVPSEPDNAFIEFLNQKIIDESVEEAKPALREELHEALEGIKRELTQLLPEKARSVVADIIGLDNDGEDRSPQQMGGGGGGGGERGIISDSGKKLLASLERRKDDMFGPIRRHIHDILAKVAEVVHRTIHEATAYTAHESADLMARSVKEALRKWDDHPDDASQGQSQEQFQQGGYQQPPSQQYFPTGNNTYDQNQVVSRGMDNGGDGMVVPRVQGEMPDNFLEAITGRFKQSSAGVMITAFAEGSDAIRWISLHVERIIQKTLALVHPAIGAYMARETAGVASHITSAFRQFIDYVMEGASAEKHWWEGIVDKIHEMDAKGKFQALEDKFRAHVHDIVAWALGKLHEIIMWLTERKLRIHLDRLPGVRVIEPVRE